MKAKIFYLLILVTVFTACRKDVDELLWDGAVSDTERNINSLFEEIQDVPETFVVNAGSNIEVLASNDVLVRIPADAMLDAGGNLVTGEVDLEIIVILSKADMIRYRATTTTSDGKFLESGGEIFIQAYKNGVPLSFDSSKNYSINVPNSNPLNDMDYFSGERDVEGNVIWDLGTPDLNSGFSNPIPSEWIVSDSVSIGGQNEFNFGYELLCDRFGWQNIDKFLTNFGEPASDNRISVAVPAGFGNSNTAAFCILNAFQTVTPMNVDIDNELFFIVGVPVGTPVSIFLVSLQEINGVETSFAEVESIVVEADHMLSYSSLTERTSAEISALLDAI